MSSANNIGIMGGTFDPVHEGHLAIAGSVAEQLELDRMLFIPTGNPNFKQDQRVTPAEQRADMVRLAIAGNPIFELDTREIDRPGITYSADTLEELAQAYPHARLLFIMGTDSAITLPKWRRAEDVARLCTIVVAQRPGQSARELDEVLVASPIAFDVMRLDVPQLDISSTDIRKRAARSESLSGMVPPVVESYIVRNNLYAS